MKTLIAIVALTFTTNGLFAQKIKDDQVPAPVTKSFAAKHPGVKAEKWEKEGENYEVEFDAKEGETSVLIDAKGNVLETEVEVGIAQLPQAAQDYIAKTYKDAKIKECEKITDAHGVVTYEADLKEKDVMFDAKGNFLKEVKDEQGDKDDDDDDDDKEHNNGKEKHEHKENK